MRTQQSYIQLFAAIGIMLGITMLFQNCASDYNKSLYSGASQLEVKNDEVVQLSFLAGHLHLEIGQSIETKNYRLVMQGDGNFVLYHKELNQNTSVWSSGQYSATLCNRNVNPYAYCYTDFQQDGNLVSYVRLAPSAELIEKFPLNCKAGAIYCDIPYWSTGTTNSGFGFRLQEQSPYWFIYGAFGNSLADSNQTSYPQILSQLK